MKPDRVIPLILLFIVLALMLFGACSNGTGTTTCTGGCGWH